MEGITELKEKLEEDSKFRALFLEIEHLDDAVAIARENGYDISIDDLEEDVELFDNLIDISTGS